jgi:putative transposase
MIRTHFISCTLPRDLANALNRESGRIYTEMLVTHYRVYRQTSYWLARKDGERLNDFYNAAKSKLLHAHSIDAAQQGFYKACKTAKLNRHLGAKYPHWRKFYRTTVWKSTGIRHDGDTLLLALARGRAPLQLPLPVGLRNLASDSFTEVRLVWDRASRHYSWHLVVDDGQAPLPSLGSNVAAIDLGEIHPATITDGTTATIICCRKLRSQKQHTNKQLGKFQAAQARRTPGSRRWKRLQQRKQRFLAKQQRRQRDIEHKISRTVVQRAVDQEVGTLAIGDVRNIGDGKRLHRNSQQKISQWSHGRLRNYLGYKAATVGIRVDDTIDEHYTSKTCPVCGHQHKPKGRIFRCTNPQCNRVFHRDVVGATNIPSRFLYGQIGDNAVAVPQPNVSYPVRVMRSSPRHGACSSGNREAAGL